MQKLEEYYENTEFGLGESCPKQEMKAWRPWIYFKKMESLGNDKRHDKQS